MDYLFFAWMASIFYGFEVVISKVVSKYTISNPWFFNFVWSFFILIFIAVPSIISHASWPRHWGNLTLAALTYALTGVFYLLALYRLDVSVLSPLFNVRTVISIFLGVFLLGENLGLFQFILVGLILISGVFVTLDERWSIKTFFSKSIFLALLTMFVLSLNGYFLKKAIAEESYWTVTLFMPLLGQIFLLPTLPKFFSDWRNVRSRSILVLALTALLGAIGSLASNRAYSQNVGTTSVIMSLPFSMFFAFIISFIAPTFLEKHPLKIYLIRFLAAFVMIAAAVKLSVN